MEGRITLNRSDTPDDGVDFTWCVNFLEKRGREQFGKHFRIASEDHDIVFRLLVYFIGDKENAARENIELEKGILLSGPVGCGKTSLMSVIRNVPPPERNFLIKSCRDVSFEFIQDGFEVISRYSKMSYNGGNPKAYCFDDLGAEQSLKYYGNECNAMAEIILSRYDLFISSRMLTHITTNLSATEIETQYGLRVRSRMREMFNLISFDKTTKDKRM